MPYPDYEIFISSPGDLRAEREAAAAVIARVSARQAHITLSAYRSEEGLYLAHEGPQERIRPTSEFDLVVCMFWKRLGSELLPARFDADDGRKRTGSEYEYETAVASARRRQQEDGRAEPAVLLFRKNAPVQFDAEHVDHERAQYQALQRFFARWVRDADDHFVGYAIAFETREEFEQLLEQQLLAWIAQQRPQARWDVASQGSPFPGLEPFSERHAAVYFGRDRCIREAQQRLRKAASDGFPVLWIVGASGSGKSSLMRAGLLPALAASDAGLRHLLLRPGDLGPQLLHGCAAALLAALPQIRDCGFPNAAELARLCDESPASACDVVHAALDRSATIPAVSGMRSIAPPARLLIAIDQAEELLTRRTAEERRQFVRLMTALLAGGRVSSVLSFRADLQLQLRRDAQLLPLYERAQQLDLPAPSAAEIVQMIEWPVQAAGFVLEVPEAGRTLLEEIGRDAGGGDSLPMLQFALRALFERARSRGGSVLRIADYQELGRAAGALGSAAEATLTQLPATVQAAFPRVLRELAEFNLQSGNLSATPIACAAALFDGDDDAAQLISALSAAECRLLTRFDVAGQPHLRVAHESLFEHWERARDQLNQDTVRLDARRRLRESASLWQAAEKRQKSARLLTGLGLHEALDLHEHWSLSDPAASLVRLSQQAAVRRDRRRRLATGVITLVALVALGAALYAREQQYRAEHSEAEGQRLLDEAARRALGRAHDQLRARNLRAGYAYLAESLRYRPAAEATATAEILLQQPPPTVPLLVLNQTSVRSARLSPDGRRLLTTAVNLDAQLWDANSGVAEAYRFADGKGASEVQFSTDGGNVIVKAENLITRWHIDGRQDSAKPVSYAPYDGKSYRPGVAISQDGRWALVRHVTQLEIWQLQQGTRIAEAVELQQPIRMMDVSPDGNTAAVATGDGKVHLFATATAEAIGEPIVLDEATSCLAFSPDGERLLVSARLAGEPIQIWWLQRRVAVALQESGPGCQGAQFSPDGVRVAVTSDAGPARLWRSSDGQKIGDLAHAGNAVTSASFSADGLRVATGGGDGNARLWWADSAEPIGMPLPHAAPPDTVQFDAEGVRVMTLSGGVVRFWDARTGTPRGLPLRHGDSVNSARFGSNGERAVTASSDGTATIWNTRNGAVVGQRMVHAAAVVDASFSPDDSRIVTASSDGTAGVWNAATGLPDARPLVHGQPVHFARFSPDGDLIATASADNQARLWNSRSGAAVAAPLRHAKMPTQLQFSPDGRLLLTLTAAKTLHLWRVPGGQSADDLLPEQTRNDVVAAVFSPADGRVAIASSRSATIWNLANRQALSLPRVPRERLHRMEYSADGLRLMTLSSTGTARLWNATSGEAIGNPISADDAFGIRHARLAPDGKRLARVSGMDLLSLWSVPSAMPLGLSVLADSRATTLDFNRTGTQLIIAGKTTATIWNLRNDLGFSPPQLIGTLHGIAGQTVDADGRMDAFGQVELGQWRDSLAQTVAAPAASELLRWHLADRRTRTIAPFTELPLPLHIRREIDWALAPARGRDGSSRRSAKLVLRDAYLADPADPLVLLALATEHPRADTRALWLHISARRLAGSRDADTVARGAEILRQLDEPQAALSAALSALRLQPTHAGALAVRDALSPAATAPTDDP